MEGLGRALLAGAGVLAVLGLGIILMARLGWHWRPLPGDLVIRRPGLVIYFPLATMILLSLMVTLAMHLVAYLKR